ncbi:MAG: ribonuclease H-like domain-containing protein [Thermodesulfovibrionales bacterium]|nr:ribonuclease H-like domain-containing protein [Thermodesulfovibrionales bacterium]
MIRSTFTILNGIGQRLERRLWREGILTWTHFLDSNNLSFINPQKKRLFDEALFSAYTELNEGNAEYFATTLKRSEHWRLFEVFKDDTVCIDIETNGFPLGRGGYVTLVGIYDGKDYKCFVRGENLTADSLNEEISKYKYLITFYGSVFDIPFLRSCFRRLRFNIPHFDLCFGARRLALKSGLKRLEQYFGIQRQDEVREMDGYDAVLLWQEVKRGNSRALDLLVLYNKEDTVNLFSMAHIIYRRLKSLTGIEEYRGNTNP